MLLVTLLQRSIMSEKSLKCRSSQYGDIIVLSISGPQSDETNSNMSNRYIELNITNEKTNKTKDQLIHELLT